MPTSAPSPIRWGILGVANIAVRDFIPALKQCEACEVVAIASRDTERARSAAGALGIGKAYGSYEELVDDPDIDAIYNPLPNHLHVPWTVRAAERGKHVLCEKPIALSAPEAQLLIDVRNRKGVQIAEAFMVRVHPQWLATRQLVASGRIGELRLITGHFSYYRRDPNDVRSKVAWGGGALMDIGCYPITMSRWIFGEEPTDVVAQLERDPDLHVDRLGSALLAFPTGQAVISFSGQVSLHQSMRVYGTKGRVELDIPFNALSTRASHIVVDDGRDLIGGGAETMSFPAVNQYVLQALNFSRAIRGVEPVAVSLEDAVNNMRVIDALFRSAETRKWERPAESPELQGAHGMANGTLTKSDVA